MTIVTEPRSESNYEDWSIQVKTYLLGQDLWAIVEAGEPAMKDITFGQSELTKAWRRKNALALHVIHIACKGQVFSEIKKISSAKTAWTTLAEKYGPKSDELSKREQEAIKATINWPGSSSDQNNQNNNNSNDGDFQLHQPLFKAVSLGDWDTAETLLDQNLEQNQKSEEGLVVISSEVFHCLKNVLLSPVRWMVLTLVKLLDVKKIYETKLVHVQILELLSVVCKVIHSSSEETQIMKAGVRRAIIEAVYQENVEFITSVAKANPKLVWSPYVAGRVLELAVKLRQPKIYSLIYGLRDKIRITSFRDENRSTILHKVASIAPSRLLNRIPGAALQMQRELQWFKEVESIAPPGARELPNHDSLKPRDIFTDSHKDLVIAGEKWMKDTSSSCSVVGALIITVTFAAVFTVPGGNHQNTGFPIFLRQKLFKVFMVSDAVALFTSTTSVLMFLAILTSRYTEEDFLVSLPTKLIIGLSTLFLSIAAMIVAFCIGLSIMFDGQSLIFIPSVCIAIIPVASFVWMQFPLLVDIFHRGIWLLV